jgi:hypothetical protein
MQVWQDGFWFLAKIMKPMLLIAAVAAAIAARCGIFKVAATVLAGAVRLAVAGAIRRSRARNPSRVADRSGL